MINILIYPKKKRIFFTIEKIKFLSYPKFINFFRRLYGVIIFIN